MKKNKPNGLKTKGDVNGPVIRYTLPPEELEKYRSMKIPPAYDSTGKIIRRAVQVS